ncbi:MAG: hypothetical protein HY897_13900 [Deltaproteobacteria bacterium]|nr:hypothetical protein [Deltaproteobacteria bacterium]
MRRIASFFFALAAASWPPAAQAGDDDAIMASSFFTLTRLGGGLQLSTEYVRERPILGGNRNYVRFEEQLQLSVDSFVLTPRLMTLNASGDLGFQQGIDSYRAPGGAGSEISNDARLFGYSLSGVLLGGRPVNLQGMSSMGRSNYTADFAPTSTMQQQSHGATLNISNSLVPTRAWFTYTERTIEDDLPGSVPRLDESAWLAQLRSRSHTARQDTTVEYRFLDLDNRIMDGADFREHVASLNNGLELARKDRVHLDSVFRFQDRESSLDYRSFDLQESLAVKHGRSLETVYDYQFGHFIWDAAEEDSHRGRFRTRHRLYASLYSEAGGHYDYLDFEGAGVQNVYGPFAAITYTKKLPLGGTLVLSPSASYDVVDRGLSGFALSAIDEPHKLTAVAPEFLQNINVAAGTIVVMDAAKTRTYAENFDYKVIVSGARTALERVVSGGIAEGDGVLVSYEYLPITAPATAVFTRSVAASVDFRVVRLSYSFTRSEETVREGPRVPGLPFVRAHVFSAANSVEDVTFEAEYRVENSNSSDFTVYSLTQRFTPTFFRKVSVGLSATESFLTNSFSDDKAVSLMATANAGIQVTPRLLLKGQLSYFDTDAQVTSDQQVAVARLGMFFNYFRIVTSLEGEYYVNNLDDLFTQRYTVKAAAKRVF